MALTKVTYVDDETVIHAQNLNDIQDEIIANGQNIGKDESNTATVESSTTASKPYSVGEHLMLDGVYYIVTTAIASGGTIVTTGENANVEEANIGEEISQLNGAITELGNIKAPVIVDTASGAIASFPDGADGLPVKDLTVAIEPVQAGTGDPSPTNVRPISGWTGANVTRVGKNLFDINSITASTNWSVTVSENILTIVHSNNYSTGLPTINLDLVQGTYVVSFSVDQSGLDMSLYNAGSYVKTLQNGSTFNVAAGDQISIKFYNTVAGTWVFTNIQLELGSTASAYEAYQGTTIPISWQSEAGTVYAALLDALAGSLKVRPYYASYNGETLVGPWISSMDAYTPGGTPTTGAQVVDLGGAETEYTIDHVTVTTLLGKNNIWADCGPSTVEYPCDTKLYIERLTAPEEDDMIANQNIASGVYFMVGNNLYLSTTAILAGDPIKPGTNCTLTNLAAALNALNS